MSEMAIRAPLAHKAPLQLAIAAITVALVVAGYLSPLAVGLLAAAVVLVLASFGFRPLLWAIVFFLPVAPYLAWDFPIRDLATLLRFALFAGTVIYSVRRGTRLRACFLKGSLTWALLGYFAIALLTATVFNPITDAAARELMRLGSYLCLYFSLTLLLEREEHFRGVFSALMASTVCVAFFGFYQFLIGDYSSLYDALYPFQDQAQKAPEWSGRITSFLGHFNSLAGYLNLQIPLFIALSLPGGREGTCRLARIALACSALALVLTQSRGALLASAAITLLSAWLLAPGRQARIRAMMAAVAFCAAAALVLGLLFQRLSGIDDYTELTRLAVWAGAGAVFRGSPWSGIGFGNLRTVLAGFIDLPDDFIIDAHNLYLELLAETGIIGWIAFTVLIILGLRMARRLLREGSERTSRVIGFAALAAIVGVLVHGGVDYMFHTSPQFSAMFFLILGMLNAAGRIPSAAAGGGA